MESPCKTYERQPYGKISIYIAEDGNVVIPVVNTDPVTVGSVALILTGTAILASLIPAWWVTRIDPVRVLQSE